MSASVIPITPGQIKSPSTLNLSGYVHVHHHPVEQTVAAICQVRQDDLHLHCRGSKVDDARLIAMLVMAEYERWSKRDVARYFGRTISAVHRSHERAKALEETDSRFRSKLHASRAALGL